MTGFSDIFNLVTAAVKLFTVEHPLVEYIYLLFILTLIKRSRLNLYHLKELKLLNLYALTELSLKVEGSELYDP